MAVRKIKTIDEARLAIVELVPAGMSLFTAVTYYDSREHGRWYQSVRYEATAVGGGEGPRRETVTAGGPTAADLYRNFRAALARFLAPRRLAAEQARTLARRAAAESDEHDHVRAGPRCIAAKPVPRLCGPTS